MTNWMKQCTHKRMRYNVHWFVELFAFSVKVSLKLAIALNLSEDLFLCCLSSDPRKSSEGCTADISHFLFSIIWPLESFFFFHSKAKNTDYWPLIVSRQVKGASSSWVRSLPGSLWVTRLPTPTPPPPPHDPPLFSPHAPPVMSHISTWTVPMHCSYFKFCERVNMNAKKPARTFWGVLKQVGVTGAAGLFSSP